MPHVYRFEGKGRESIDPNVRTARGVMSVYAKATVKYGKEKAKNIPLSGDDGASICGEWWELRAMLEGGRTSFQLPV